MQPEHRIDELIVDLSFTTARLARHEKALLSDWLSEDLLPALDQLFSQYSSGKQILRFETLEFDFGNLTSRNYQQTIREQLLQKFAQLLPTQLLAVTPANLRLSASSMSGDNQNTQVAITQLFNYLSTGQLSAHWPFEQQAQPINRAEAKKTDLHQQLLDAVIAQQNIAELLRELPQREVLIQRLLTQFSVPQRLELLRQLAPQHLQHVIALLDLLQFFETNNVDTDFSSLHLSVFDFHLDNSFVKNHFVETGFIKNDLNQTGIKQAGIFNQNGVLQNLVWQTLLQLGLEHPQATEKFWLNYILRKISELLTINETWLVQHLIAIKVPASPAATPLVNLQTKIAQLSKTQNTAIENEFPEAGYTNEFNLLDGGQQTSPDQLRQLIAAAFIRADASQLQQLWPQLIANEPQLLFSALKHYLSQAEIRQQLTMHFPLALQADIIVFLAPIIKTLFFQLQNKANELIELIHFPSNDKSGEISLNKFPLVEHGNQQDRSTLEPTLSSNKTLVVSEDSPELFLRRLWEIAVGVILENGSAALDGKYTGNAESFLMLLAAHYAELHSLSSPLLQQAWGRLLFDKQENNASDNKVSDFRSNHIESDNKLSPLHEQQLTPLVAAKVSDTYETHRGQMLHNPEPQKNPQLLIPQTEKSALVTDSGLLEQTTESGFVDSNKELANQEAPSLANKLSADLAGISDHQLFDLCLRLKSGALAWSQLSHNVELLQRLINSYIRLGHSATAENCADFVAAIDAQATLTNSAVTFYLVVLQTLIADKLVDLEAIAVAVKNNFNPPVTQHLSSALYKQELIATSEARNPMVAKIGQLEELALQLQQGNIHPDSLDLSSERFAELISIFISADKTITRDVQADLTTAIYQQVQQVSRKAEYYRRVLISLVRKDAVDLIDIYNQVNNHNEPEQHISNDKSREKEINPVQQSTQVIDEPFISQGAVSSSITAETNSNQTINPETISQLSPVSITQTDSITEIAQALLSEIQPSARLQALRLNATQWQRLAVELIQQSQFVDQASKTELITAIQNQSAQIVDPVAYYRLVIDAVLKHQPIDLEAFASTKDLSTELIPGQLSVNAQDDSQRHAVPIAATTSINVIAQAVLTEPQSWVRLQQLQLELEGAQWQKLSIELIEQAQFVDQALKAELIAAIQNTPSQVINPVVYYRLVIEAILKRQPIDLEAFTVTAAGSEQQAEINNSRYDVADEVEETDFSNNKINQSISQRQFGVEKNELEPTKDSLRFTENDNAFVSTESASAEVIPSQLPVNPQHNTQQAPAQISVASSSITAETNSNQTVKPEIIPQLSPVPITQTGSITEIAQALLSEIQPSARLQTLHLDVAQWQRLTVELIQQSQFFDQASKTELITAIQNQSAQVINPVVYYRLVIDAVLKHQRIDLGAFTATAAESEQQITINNPLNDVNREAGVADFSNNKNNQSVSQEQFGIEKDESEPTKDSLRFTENDNAFVSTENASAELISNQLPVNLQNNTQQAPVQINAASSSITTETNSNQTINPEAISQLSPVPITQTGSITEIAQALLLDMQSSARLQALRLDATQWQRLTVELIQQSQFVDQASKTELITAIQNQSAHVINPVAYYRLVIDAVLKHQPIDLEAFASTKDLSTELIPGQLSVNAQDDSQRHAVPIAATTSINVIAQAVLTEPQSWVRLQQLQLELEGAQWQKLSIELIEQAQFVDQALKAELIAAIQNTPSQVINPVVYYRLVIEAILKRQPIDLEAFTVTAAGSEQQAEINNSRYDVADEVEETDFSNNKINQSISQRQFGVEKNELEPTKDSLRFTENDNAFVSTESASAEVIPSQLPVNPQHNTQQAPAQISVASSSITAETNSNQTVKPEIIPQLSPVPITQTGSITEIAQALLSEIQPSARLQTLHLDVAQWQRLTVELIQQSQFFDQASKTELITAIQNQSAQVINPVVYYRLVIDAVLKHQRIDLGAFTATAAESEQQITINNPLNDVNREAGVADFSNNKNNQSVSQEQFGIEKDESEPTKDSLRFTENDNAFVSTENASAELISNQLPVNLQNNTQQAPVQINAASSSITTETNSNQTINPEAISQLSPVPITQTGSITEIAQALLLDMQSSARLQALRLDATQWQRLTVELIQQSQFVDQASKTELITAIQNQSAQVVNPVAYYRLVIDAVLKHQPIDLEAFTATATAAESEQETEIDNPRNNVTDEVAVPITATTSANVIAQTLLAEPQSWAHLQHLRLEDAQWKKLSIELIRQTPFVEVSSSSELIDAIQVQARQAINTSVYYRLVINAVLQKQPIDLEAFAATAIDKGQNPAIDDVGLDSTDIVEVVTITDAYSNQSLNQADNGMFAAEQLNADHIQSDQINSKQPTDYSLLTGSDHSLRRPVLSLAQLLAAGLPLNQEQLLALQQYINTLLNRPNQAMITEWRELLAVEEHAQVLIHSVPAHLLHQIAMRLQAGRYVWLDALVKVVMEALALLVADINNLTIKQARWGFVFNYLFASADNNSNVAETSARATALSIELCEQLAIAAGINDVQRLVNLAQRRIALLKPPAQQKPAMRLQDITTNPATHSDATTPQWEAGLHINNAGQVLAAAFLPRLFSMLNLMQDGKFIHLGAADRAVHLVQFMVTGQSATPEYELILNKILCGIGTSIPVSAGIDITEQEQTLIEQMLTSMIQHWKVLGSTSINGLRETFFQRQGWLVLEEDCWRLKVKEQTFDLLLDRLPWSMSLIKHGWMDKPLRVSWRNHS
jgi:hypothetical protein